jgi:SAM-dependent methyltransferase
MASHVDTDAEQQQLKWAAACQQWDQHCDALATPAGPQDAGERADGVTALESKLGTRAHWDGVYERELRNFAHDPSDEGVDWFSDDVGDRLMEYVTENCPLGDGVLDLGCGSAVFLTDLATGREGRFLGVDYSETAIALAASVGQRRGLTQVRFCHADCAQLEALEERFGLVLDKGTFDAYMLGASASVDRYAASVLAALKPEGVFVVTTCNSTADEVSALFTARGFAEKDRVPYPTFEFGGQEGSVIATVAFVGGG